MQKSSDKMNRYAAEIRERRIDLDKLEHAIHLAGSGETSEALRARLPSLERMYYSALELYFYATEEWIGRDPNSDVV